MNGTRGEFLGGYHGRYLLVDASTETATYCPLTSETLRRYLGGSGLGTHLLLQWGAAESPALDPNCPLVFAFSALVDSPLTTSAKFAVVSKSPLTDRINDSLASSGFAIAGKRTGSDAIVVVGRATCPSIIIVDNGRVRFENARDLWGRTCQDSEAELRQRLGKDYEIAVIGPAGEMQIPFSTISHNRRHAGRGGGGAVMGSKNVKALAVRGEHSCHWADARSLNRLAQQLSKKSLGPATAKYRELGTATNLLLFNRLGALPTENFRKGSHWNAHALSPESLAETRDRTRAYCESCTIGCEHIYSLTPRDAPPATSDTVRVEYQNLCSLGPLCGVSDPDLVLRASRRCDQLGLDTISTGGTVAFAMECVQRGLLDEQWLKFGDGKALLKAIELIGKREGFGELLALGSRRLAVQIGGDALDFAPQVKGLEIPGYEPRALQTMALGFAVGSRGADHNRSGAYEADFAQQTDRRTISDQSARQAIATEDKAAIMDSLILCKFLRGVFKDFYAEAAEMMRFVTGWEFTADELKTTASRIVTAKKLFNIRAGWQPSEDTLPQRFLDSPLEDDEAARMSARQLQQAISQYNTHRGWTEEGWIEETHLRSLGLV